MNRILNLIHKFYQSKNLRNSYWIIGEQFFQMLVSLVVGMLSARYLGPSNYGSLNYTASFVSFFTSIATLGMEGVVIKKMIDEPDREGDLLGSAMGLRFCSSLLSMVSVTVIVLVLNPGEPIKVALVLLQSLQLMFKSVQILDSWFQRYLKSKYVSIGKMIACIVVAAYKIFLLATQRSLVWFAFSNSLTDLVISIVLIIFYKRERTQKLQFHKATGLFVLKDSYHFIISGLMTSIYSQMDKIMIGQMMTDTDVGYYTTATTICAMWVFIPTAIINSFRPMILEIKKGGNEQLYIRRLEQLYSAVIWLCLGASFIISVLSRFIVSVLYGEAYLGSVSALKIAIWYETFAMIGTARGIWILAENKNKYVKYYLFIGAVVNVILNFALIPTYGINGAALATLITQITTSVVSPLFFKETRVHTKIVLEAFACKWVFIKNRSISK